MKRSIGELLFDGYEDTVMDIASSMDNEDEYFEDEEEKDANKVPMDKFGWFYQVCLKYSGYLGSMLPQYMALFVCSYVSCVSFSLSKTIICRF